MFIRRFIGMRAVPLALLFTLVLLWGCGNKSSSPNHSQEPEVDAVEGPSLHGFRVPEHESSPLGKKGQLLCGGPFFLELLGEDMVFVGDRTPTITMTDDRGQVVEGEVVSAMLQQECPPIEGVEESLRCDRVYVVLPPSPARNLYTSELTLTNPDVEGFAGSATLLLTILPPPSIATVSPSLAWFPEGGREVEVHGSGFLVLDSGEGAGEELPEVFVNKRPGSSPLEVLDVDHCEPVNLTGQGFASAKICSTIKVRMMEPGSLTVQNPVPLGCNVSGRGVVEFPDDDQETWVTEPPFVCDVGGGRSVTASSSRVPLYQVEGQNPTVTVDGVLAPTELEQCEREDGVEACGRATIALPPSLETLGEVAVVLTHPSPLDLPLEGKLYIATAPELVRATPNQVSTNQGPQTVVVTTTGFIGEGGWPYVTMRNAAGDVVELDVELLDQTQDGQPNCEIVRQPGPIGMGLARCLEFEVTIPPEVLTEAYSPELMIGGFGNGCSAASTSILTITP